MGTGLYRLYWSLARSALIWAVGIAEQRGQLAHHLGVLLGRHPRQGDVLGHLVADQDAVAAVE